MASQLEQHVFVNPNHIYVFSSSFFPLREGAKNGGRMNPTFKWTPLTFDQGRDSMGLLGPGQETLTRKRKKNNHEKKSDNN